MGVTVTSPIGATLARSNASRCDAGRPRNGRPATLPLVCCPCPVLQPVLEEDIWAASIGGGQGGQARSRAHSMRTTASTKKLHILHTLYLQDTWVVRGRLWKAGPEKGGHGGLRHTTKGRKESLFAHAPSTDERATNPCSLPSLARSLELIEWL